MQRARLGRGSAPHFVVAMLAILFLVSGPAAGTAQRTFVGSQGTDNPNCSIAAPCRGFAAAILATSPGGEVIVLDSAGYGSVTVTKAVSIISPAGIYAGITVFSGSDGVTVNAGVTDNVVLRGLSINGQGGGIGIKLVQARRLRVENCVISNMAGNGIEHHATGGEMIVLDTLVRDNGGMGINVVGDETALLDHVRSEHNATQGLYVFPLNGTVSVTIVDSVFAYNGSNGVWVGVAATGATTSAFVQAERSVMSENGDAGFRATASGTVQQDLRIALVRSAIHHNVGDGVLVSTTGSASAKGGVSENSVTGNDGYGIHAAGGGIVEVSANTVRAGGSGLAAMACEATAHIGSLGNNNAESLATAGGCFSSGPGY